MMMPEATFCIWMKFKYLFFYIGNEPFTKSIKMKHLDVSTSQTSVQTLSSLVNTTSSSAIFRFFEVVLGCWCVVVVVETKVCLKML